MSASLDLKLRKDLALGRIGMIPDDKGTGSYRVYFNRMSEFFLNPTYDNCLSGKYEESFLDPAYAVRSLGEGYGQLLSFISYESLNIIPFRAEGLLFDEVILLELFLRIYDLFYSSEEGDRPETAEIKETIKSHYYDYLEHTASFRIREQIDPSLGFAYDIIMDSDLNNTDYLYRFGEYIDEDVIRISEHLSSLPEERIRLMADTFTEGFRKGFEVTGKDISRKSSVNIQYNLGFERVVRASVENFRRMGLKTTFMRRALYASNRNSLIRVGYSGAVSNRQMDFDHRDDRAIFLDRDFVEKKLYVMDSTYSEYSAFAASFAGPAVMETFGQEPFSPVIKKEAIKMSGEQRKLMLEMSSRMARISNKYLPLEKRSYTLISYPVPKIGPSFKEIFDETININTLDYDRYRDMQQLLILQMEKGNRVRIRGKGKNKTDITVSLMPLKDPERDSVFENCVADVNIPLGEVFTSPYLQGTSGTLFVSEVYLFGLRYENLEFKIENGYVTDYSCTNFPDEKANRDYIKENILHNHETLPIGEFAIGTNTTAYRMARKYDIFSRLDILIAEKTGPHFAFGDTCYSRSEDVRVFNPDGREIISKDNEYTLKRKSDADFRYFECHTDVTIPYDELDSITAIDKEGREYPVIENGLFTVAGCAELNEPLFD